MKALSLGLLTLLLPLVACDSKEEEPAPLTIVDKSAEEAADLTLEVACDYVARCGIVEYSCPDCEDGVDCGDCTAEQVPVSYEQCEQELAPDFLGAFSCQELTAEEQALVDECLAALPTAACPSIEVAGDGREPAPDQASQDLAACDVFETLVERCHDADPAGVPEELPSA